MKNMDILNGIGDWFISDEQKKLNESLLKDAELQRQQNAQLLQYMSQKKAMASGDSSTANNKYIILGGVAILMVFTIIMIK
jgi:hypothetical protein